MAVGDLAERRERGSREKQSRMKKEDAEDGVAMRLEWNHVLGKILPTDTPNDDAR